MARSRNTADTQTASGGPVSPNIAGKNAIINGGMDIWQRGTSFAIASSTATYTADRWCVQRNATGSTISRQATGDTTNLPFIQYGLRIQRDSGNTSTQLIAASQSFESVNSIPLAGKTITVSFYAKAGANYSSASSIFKMQIYSGTGTDQNVLNGLTGGAVVIDGSATLTTTYQRFSFTGTVATTATQLAIYSFYTPVGTAGANDWAEITGVQIDVGSSATPFSRAGGTIAGELDACQRYYQNFNTGSGYIRFGQGLAQSTTVAYILTPFTTKMRTIPSSMDYYITSNAMALWDGVSIIPVTAISTDLQSNTLGMFTATASGLTQYRTYMLIGNNNSTAFVAFSAEL